MNGWQVASLALFLYLSCNTLYNNQFIHRTVIKMFIMLGLLIMLHYEFYSEFRSFCYNFLGFEYPSFKRIVLPITITNPFTPERRTYFMSSCYIQMLTGLLLPYSKFRPFFTRQNSFISSNQPPFIVRNALSSRYFYIPDLHDNNPYL